MEILARTAGIIGIAGAILLAWTSWAISAASAEVARVVVPGLLLGSPLVWLGVSLVLTPTLARMLAGHGTEIPRQATEDSPAYVNCPDCEELVRVSADHCPYCGEPLVGPRARVNA